MMIGSVTKNIELKKIRARSLESDFYLEMQVSKIGREKLFVLENRRYAEIIAKYNHLQVVEIIDNDNKAELPVHLVTGANAYTQINTKNAPKIGRQGEPSWLDNNVP